MKRFKVSYDTAVAAGDSNVFRSTEFMDKVGSDPIDAGVKEEVENFKDIWL